MTEPLNEKRGNVDEKATEVPEEPRFEVPAAEIARLNMPDWSLPLGVPFVLICAHPTFALEKYRFIFSCIGNPPNVGGADHWSAKVPYPEGFKSDLERARQAVMSGALPVQSPEMRRAAEEGRCWNIRVLPGDLVAWCQEAWDEEARLEFPEELLRLKFGERTQPGDVSNHPALNPEHPYYCEELAWCLRLWDSLYSRQTRRDKQPDGGAREVIRNRLKQLIAGDKGSSSVLSDTALTRIVTVVNPFSRGGRPSKKISKT